MGLGGGDEISQYRVRFSHDLLMMNVMFETSVLSVNWRGSAVGMRSDGLVGESYQILRLSTCDWDWVTPLAFRRVRFTVCEIDFRDQGANLGRRICYLVEHFKTVAQARWLSGFRQY